MTISAKIAKPAGAVNGQDERLYSLTEAGEKEFESLMFTVTAMPIHIFLDFNAAIVNLPGLSPESQKTCLENIQKNVNTLKAYLEGNMKTKENQPDIPETGMAVLQQQLILVQALETWLMSIDQ